MSHEPIVFVVDDDASVQRALTRLLSSQELKVRTFNSGEEFLEAFEPAQPGCLVLDVGMPGMSGTALSDILCARGASMPVIFITGHVDGSQMADTVRNGAFGFLEKPFRGHALLSTVQRAIEYDAKQRKA